MAGAGEQRRTWHPGRPVDVHTTLGSLRRGSGDPTHRRASDGSLWRTARTPAGPGTVRYALRPAEGSVEATAWGSGADWLLDALPAFLGNDDDPSGFVPGRPFLRDLAARHAGWRVPRTGLVLESLVPAILEQKVTGLEARRAWRTLLQWYGEPAPGPAPPGMRVMPSADQWARVPSWDWHRAGVDGKRSRAIVEAAQVADRLEQTVGMPPEAAARRLRSIPGVGVWTAAEVAQRALGDADAVSLGDFHLARWVGWALAGELADDDRMLELLEPWAGHRYRVIRLVELSPVRPPKFGPRYSPRDYRAI